MRKFVLLILITFFISSFCYAGWIEFRDYTKLKGTIVYQNDNFLYIYTKEKGLFEIPKDRQLIFQTTTKQYDILVPSETMKKIDEFKKQDVHKNDSFSVWQERKGEAKQRIRCLIKYKKEWVTPKDKKVNELIEQANFSYEKELWEKALDLYKEALKLDSSKTSIFKDKISKCEQEIKFYKEQTEKGLIKYKGKWVTPKEKEADILIIKANFYYGIENWAEALQLYKQALKLDSSKTSVLKDKITECEQQVKFEKEQKEKGLIKYGGQWITPESASKLKEKEKTASLKKRKIELLYYEYCYNAGHEGGIEDHELGYKCNPQEHYNLPPIQIVLEAIKISMKDRFPEFERSVFETWCKKGFFDGYRDGCHGYRKRSSEYGLW